MKIYGQAPTVKLSHLGYPRTAGRTVNTANAPEYHVHECPNAKEARTQSLEDGQYPMVGVPLVNSENPPERSKEAPQTFGEATPALKELTIAVNICAEPAFCKQSVSVIVVNDEISMI
ncbi:hypothetical protein N7523_005845 [Penicillium sp. IBT 18751x]|nr:hypothetical protein N7523_005845 [Penicillium sp. IBT 18751x]